MICKEQKKIPEAKLSSKLYVLRLHGWLLAVLEKRD